MLRVGPAHALKAAPDRQARLPRLNRALAQEPKGQTSIEKLARHFHLPINAAGRELGICPTVLKKICRKHGLTRWPHRKVCAVSATAVRASLCRAAALSMHASRLLHERVAADALCGAAAAQHRPPAGEAARVGGAGRPAVRLQRAHQEPAGQDF